MMWMIFVLWGCKLTLYDHRAGSRDGSRGPHRSSIIKWFYFCWESFNFSKGKNKKIVRWRLGYHQSHWGGSAHQQTFHQGLPPFFFPLCCCFLMYSFMCPTDMSSIKPVSRNVKHIFIKFSATPSYSFCSLTNQGFSLQHRPHKPCCFLFQRGSWFFSQKFILFV